MDNGELAQKRGLDKCTTSSSPANLPRYICFSTIFPGVGTRASSLRSVVETMTFRSRKSAKSAGHPRTPLEQAAEAEVLLIAKDSLNAAAKPANGASIAFTLLVAGDDETTTVKRHWLNWVVWPVVSTPIPAAANGDGDGPPSTPAEDGGTGNSPALSIDAASKVAPTVSPRDGIGGNGAGNSASRPSGWGGQAPSRTSLAKLAYPGSRRQRCAF